MAHPFQITVKQTITELRQLQRSHGELIGKRLLMLIEIKRHEKTGISKRDLSRNTGINHNSIVKWRQVYNQYGIEPLLKHGRVGGFKKSVAEVGDGSTGGVVFCRQRSDLCVNRGDFVGRSGGFVCGFGFEQS